MKEIQIISNLAPNEVYWELKRITSSKPPLFKGEISEDRFALIRHAFFSNNCLNPMICGSIEKNPDGSVLYVKCVLSKAGKIAFWCTMGITIILALFSIGVALAEHSFEPLQPLIALLGFELFCNIIYQIPFRIKSRDNIALLKKILKAK